MPISLQANLYIDVNKRDNTAIPVSYAYGNKSTSTFIQGVAPYSSSAQGGAINALIIEYNNGILSGEQPPNTSGNNFPAKKNIRFSELTQLTESMRNSPPVQMTYKYVPYGFPDTTADMYRECTTKNIDQANYQSINTLTIAELSSSFGMEIIGSGGPQPPFSFGGTISTVGSAASYKYILPSLPNGRTIAGTNPGGQSSYKIPDGYSQIESSAIIAFWVFVEGFPPSETPIWCTDMPQSPPGDELWNPYAGIMVSLTSGGYITVARGDAQGSSSSNRRLYTSQASINPNSWNFIVIRVSNKNIAATVPENFIWIYKNAGRGFAWNTAGYTASSPAGTGGNIGFTANGGMVYSPGTAGRYFAGQIGHHYFFYEANVGILPTNQLTFDKFEQMAWVTDSGSYQLYT